MVFAFTQRLKIKSEWLICLYDTLSAFISIPVALYLMMGTEMSDFTFSYLTKLSFVYGLVCCSIFVWLQTYKGLWKFLSLFDVFILFLAVIAASFFSKPLTLLMSQAEALPGFAMILTAQITLCLILIPRFFYRVWIDRHVFTQILLKPVLLKRALILGDGHLAEVLLNVLRYNSDLVPVGFLSKDTHEVNRSFHGLKVFGSFDDLDETLAELETLQKKPTHLLLLDDQLSERQIAFFKKRAKTLGLETKVFTVTGLFS